jgi:uncharacterized protein YfaA (DUF2138 family)
VSKITLLLTSVVPSALKKNVLHLVGTTDFVLYFNRCLEHLEVTLAFRRIEKRRVIP